MDINFTQPVRSKHARAKIGHVLPDAPHDSRKRVALINGDRGGEIVDWGKDSWTVWLYDDQGRCNSHKAPSLNDLENFER